MKNSIKLWYSVTLFSKSGRPSIVYNQITTDRPTSNMRPTKNLIIFLVVALFAEWLGLGVILFAEWLGLGVILFAG